MRKELRYNNYLICNDLVYQVKGFSSDNQRTIEACRGKGIVKFHNDDLQPIPITEEWLLKLGYKFYNGQTSGTLCMDFGGRLDIDYYENKIQLKSHYEGEQLYRPLNIKHIHQLQNLYFDLSGEELSITKQK